MNWAAGENKTVVFHVSTEEDEQIEIAVKLTGLTKQDYITRRLLCRDVVVQGNPHIFKALRDQLAVVLTELRRVESGSLVNEELLTTINMIADILGGLKDDANLYGELIFDVNSAYFHNHGGYEFAKQFKVEQERHRLEELDAAKTEAQI